MGCQKKLWSCKKKSPIEGGLLTGVRGLIVEGHCPGLELHELRNLKPKSN